MSDGYEERLGKGALLFLEPRPHVPVRSPLEEHLETVGPEALRRALAATLKNGPCEIPDCFVCATEF